MSSNNDIFSERASLIKTPTEDIFSLRAKEIEAPEGESFGQAALRNIARTGARAGESILGIPGDVTSLIQSIPGGIASLFGVDPEKISKATEVVKTLSPFGALKGAGELKELTTKATGEFLKPQSSAEEFTDEVTEFVAPLLVPMKGSGALQKGKKLFTTLAKATAATGIGKTVEGLTDSPGVGQAAQIGSYTIMSLMNPKGMTQYINRLYEKADRALPKEGSKLGLIKTGQYKKRLGEFRKQIDKSLSPSSSEKKILNKIDEILKRAPDEVHPKIIEKTKRSINSELNNLISETVDKTDKKNLRNAMKKLSGITNETLKQYGKINPRYWKNLAAADEAFATKAQTEFMAKTLKKTLKSKEYPSLFKTLPYLFGAGVSAVKPLAGTALPPLYFTGRFAARYAKSPTLRKYYNQIFKGAAAGNAKIVRSAAEKLENELSKEEVNQ